MAENSQPSGAAPSTPATKAQNQSAQQSLGHDAGPAVFTAGAGAGPASETNITAQNPMTTPLQSPGANAGTQPHMPFDITKPESILGFMANSMPADDFAKLIAQFTPKAVAQGSPVPPPPQPLAPPPPPQPPAHIPPARPVVVAALPVTPAPLSLSQTVGGSVPAQPSSAIPVPGATPQPGPSATIDSTAHSSLRVAERLSHSALSALPTLVGTPQYPFQPIYPGAKQDPPVGTFFSQFEGLMMQSQAPREMYMLFLTMKVAHDSSAHFTLTQTMADATSNGVTDPVARYSLCKAALMRAHSFPDCGAKAAVHLGSIKQGNRPLNDLLEEIRITTLALPEEDPRHPSHAATGQCLLVPCLQTALNNTYQPLLQETLTVLMIQYSSTRAANASAAVPAVGQYRYHDVVEKLRLSAASLTTDHAQRGFLYASTLAYAESGSNQATRDDQHTEQGGSHFPTANTQRRASNEQGVMRVGPRCFNCHQFGHLARECTGAWEGTHVDSRPYYARHDRSSEYHGRVRQSGHHVIAESSRPEDSVAHATARPAPVAKPQAPVGRPNDPRHGHDKEANM